MVTQSPKGGEGGLASGERAFSSYQQEGREGRGLGIGKSILNQAENSAVPSSSSKQIPARQPKPARGASADTDGRDKGSHLHTHLSALILPAASPKWAWTRSSLISCQ